MRCPIGARPCKHIADVVDLTFRLLSRGEHERANHILSPCSGLPGKKRGARVPASQGSRRMVAEKVCAAAHMGHGPDALPPVCRPDEHASLAK
jgi:hypothetical protein